MSTKMEKFNGFHVLLSTLGYNNVRLRVKKTNMSRSKTFKY